MFWSFCSAKGGVGTSVVTAAIARQLARNASVLMVDLVDDQPDLLGLDRSGRPGLRDWLTAEEEIGHEALLGLTEHVVDGLHLLRSGAIHELSTVLAARAVDVVASTSDAFDLVIADLGVVSGSSFDPATVLAAASDRTSLVVRACYLALKRAGRLSIAFDDLIEVVEGGRALRTVDIEGVFAQPVVARVPVDPAIARAVDAGLLSVRIPRSLRRALNGLVDSAGPDSA